MEEMETREPHPEIDRLTKQVQDLKMKNEKLQSAHDEVSVVVCLSFPVLCCEAKVGLIICNAV